MIKNNSNNKNEEMLVQNSTVVIDTYFENQLTNVNDDKIHDG